MQINSVGNSQNPSFGHVTFSKGAASILRKSVQDSNIETKRLEKSIEYATKNDKVDVNFYLNDDNKTLFACFINKKNKNIIRRSTENFLTRLVEGPVEFVQNMILKAERYAEKI